MKSYLLISILLLFSCTQQNRQMEFSSTLVQQKSVIFILMDDIGYEVPACNGGQSYETSNIDSMASQGMNYTFCHATPKCSPSRFMLMTGKYNFRNYKTWGNLKDTNKTIGNLFQDNGYRTAVFGKWQLGGGNTSITKFGFESRCVTLPFPQMEDSPRYKNPVLYDENGYVPLSLRQDKYADDIFTDSIINFAARNKNNPFFIYYPMSLCHQPYSPTPDDTAFASWSPQSRVNDTSYFRSMVKYMDKKVGQILQFVKDSLQNTIVILVGDNGTGHEIYSQWNGVTVEGGKSYTTEYGTHVPMVVYGNGTGIDTSLIDFTDYELMLANIIGVTVPQSYGATDGKEIGTRDYIYCYYRPSQTEVLKEWSQNRTFKVYRKVGNPLYFLQDEVFIDSPYTYYQKQQRTLLINNSKAIR